tara:strand:- start:39 stop:218 length:180 start_codon:yes stop_codon:yes gene_type:complete
MSNSFSQEERESLTITIADLTRLLGTVEDKELKEKLEENILGLCDQLKSRLIMDMHRER